MHDDIMHAPNCGMMWADLCQNGHLKVGNAADFCTIRNQGGKSVKQNSCDSDRTPNRQQNPGKWPGKVEFTQTSS